MGKMYLDYLEEKHGLRILREVSIGPFRVDGLIERLHKQIHHPPLFENIPKHARIVLEIKGGLFLFFKQHFLI